MKTQNRTAGRKGWEVSLARQFMRWCRANGEDATDSLIRDFLNDELIAPDTVSDTALGQWAGEVQLPEIFHGEAGLDDLAEMVTPIVSEILDKQLTRLADSW